MYDQVWCPVFSRHDLIFLTFDFKLETGPPKIVYYRDFKNINYLKLESAINNINWNNIYELNTVDEQVQYLQNNRFSKKSSGIFIEFSIVHKIGDNNAI